MNLFSLERRQADSLQENHLVRLKYQSVSWNEKSQYCLNRNSYKRRKFSLSIVPLHYIPSRVEISIKFFYR